MTVSSPAPATASGGFGAVLAAPGAKRLLTSSVAGRLPLGMTLAILLLVRDATGSFGPAGAVVGAFGLASAACGPLLGRLVDRHGQVAVLVPCAVLNAALLAAIIVSAHWRAPLAVLVALGALAGASGPPIAACVRVLWPMLVGDDPGAREAAYAMDAIVQELVWVTGPLSVGALVAIATPAVAVAAMAVVGLAGTVWFAGAPVAQARGGHGERHPRSGLGAGQRVLIAGSVGVGLTMGCMEVGLPGLAHDVGAPGATGALLALCSVGSLTGGVAFGLRRWSSPLELRLAVLLAASAVVIVPLLVAGSLGVALAGAFLSGLGFAPALSCLYALVGRLAPAAAITEAFTFNGAAIGGGVATGVAIGGVLVDAGGGAAAFAFGIASTLAAAAIVARRRSALAAA
jgi:MFS family permease